MPARPRLELRLTLGFGLAMALLLATMAIILYLAMGAVLLDEIDTGLRERAATVEAGLPSDASLTTSPALVEPNEAFVQVLRPSGAVIATSGPPARVIGATEARTTRPHLLTRRVANIAGQARILTLPVTTHGQRYVVVVGASLADRTDALRMVTRFFLIAGPIALALASAAGWLVARRALATAMTTERRFLDHASHELRTPLTALKAELDLAAARPRTAHELEDAIHSAAEETDRLVRLANDLLVLSRARAGRVTITREPVSLRELIYASSNAFRARAASRGVTITTDVPEIDVEVDAARMRQALDNLLDNALRHARQSVSVISRVDGHDLSIEVTDDGPGFTPETAHHAFDPFSVGGLGLSIVQTIAQAHDGHATIEPNLPAGGARVTLQSTTR